MLLTFQKQINEKWTKRIGKKRNKRKSNRWATSELNTQPNYIYVAHSAGGLALLQQHSPPPTIHCKRVCREWRVPQVKCVCVCFPVCVLCYQTMCQLTLCLAWGGGVEEEEESSEEENCVRATRKVATGSATTMPIIADATSTDHDEPPAKCCKYCEGMPRTYLHTNRHLSVYI